MTGYHNVLCPRRLDLTQPEPEATLFRRIELAGLNPDDFETTQRFVSSRDGARIPMFIVQRKGTPRDGNNPTLLYGYGGPSACPRSAEVLCLEHQQTTLSPHCNRLRWPVMCDHP